MHAVLTHRAEQGAGNIAAASAALRNWILNLHVAVAPQGIYAAHIAIAAWIGKGGLKSDPDAIADATGTCTSSAPNPNCSTSTKP